MHDYALKAVEARKQGLVYDRLGKTELAKRKQIEADLYSTKLDVADLSRRNLEKSKKELSVLEDKLKLEKMSAEFIKKHAAEIEKINVLEAKVSEQRKVSNAIAQQAVAPFKAITSYLKEIPVLGKLLTPMLDSLEDKLTKTFEDKAQSTLFKKLSGDLNKSKQSLSSMLPDGVQLEQVLGESANSSSALSAGMESTAAASEGLSGIISKFSLGAAAFVAIAATVVGIARHVNEIRDASIDISREQGLAADKAWDYQLAINKATYDASKYGIALGGMSKEITELNTHFNDTFESSNQLTESNMQMGAYMMKNMNASVDEAIKFEKATALAGNRMDIS